MSCGGKYLMKRNFIDSLGKILDVLYGKNDIDRYGYQYIKKHSNNLHFDNIDDDIFEWQIILFCNRIDTLYERFHMTKDAKIKLINYILKITEISIYKYVEHLVMFDTDF